MPRKLPSQVPQTVSRLLASGFLKQPPVFLDALVAHPPQPIPARHEIARPDEDLPVRLQSKARSSLPSSSSRYFNVKKKARSLGPILSPKPIVYIEDRIRRQFFRDHPWEAYRPQTLVELTDKVSLDSRPVGDPKSLRSYGRNPSVEDFIKCTIEAHRQGKLSLSQAYHNTLSSYHALRAEHENATRYANVEARYYGADLGKSETMRGFEREERQLLSWAKWASGQAGSVDNALLHRKVPRVKRVDDTFTLGRAYLDAAQAFRDGKIDLSRFTEPNSTATTAPAPALATTSTTPTSSSAPGTSVEPKDTTLSTLDQILALHKTSYAEGDSKAERSAGAPDKSSSTPKSRFS